MLVKITIELVTPGKKTKMIASGRIWNTGKGTPTMGEYGYALSLERRKDRYVGTVHKFKRLRLNVWHLMYKVLWDVMLGKHEIVLSKKESK